MFYAKKIVLRGVNYMIYIYLKGVKFNVNN